MAGSGWRKWGLRLAALLAILFILVFVDAVQKVLADRATTNVAVIGTANVEQILGPSDFAAVGDDIGADFGVTANPALLLSVGGALRVFDTTAWFNTGLREVQIVGHQPESFALDPDGTMLAIADGYFGTLNQDGEVLHAVPMPQSGMRLAPSSQSGAVYLFGGADKDYRLYRFVEDGTLQILLESEDPIVAVADNSHGVYAASASVIMQIKKGTPDILFVAPDDFSGPIRSLAVTEDGLILFSTDTKIYALLGKNALSIVNNAGGTLRLRDGILYVLDPNRKLVFSLRPASLQLLSGVLQ